MLSDFEKEKVFWTRKMNLKLVKFIESKPNIWNPKHPEYTTVRVRDQTYAEFAARYGGQFTGQAVKDRWTNIRSTFANYSRKVKASQIKSNLQEYKVVWPLWNACQFLKRLPKKLSTDPEEVPQIKEEYTDTELPAENENWFQEDNYKSSENISDSVPNCQNIADNIVDLFKHIQTDPFGLDNTKNGMVGRLVSKKLSKMNSYDASVITSKIFEILALYDDNNPLNPNSKLL